MSLLKTNKPLQPFPDIQHDQERHENARFLFGNAAGATKEAGVRPAIFLAFVVLTLPIAAAPAQVADQTHRFAILRNGDRIGTNTISVRCDGPNTLVAISTSIAVKIGFLTLYRFDQSESERWVAGHFVSMKSTTDDDGTMHRVEAAARDGGLTVTANGKTKRMPGTLLPSSLWNVALARRTSALSTVDGAPMRIAVTDQGDQEVPVQGRQIPAHHYSLRGIYSQDVWYDNSGNLVRLQLRGSDGSTILYQPMAG